jgi:hypothetical protein
MERRRVPIDWDELEMALTWPSDERDYFLDVTTGQVIGPHDEDVEEEDLEEGFASGRLIRVDSLPSSVEYGWMEEFAEGVRNPHFRELLEVALRGSGAFRRFKDVVSGHAVQRERWFALRRERLVEVMRDWLEANELEPTTEPRRLS